MSKDELMALPVGELAKAYRKYSRETVYDYHEHVRLAEELDHMGKLPATFMVTGAGSWDDSVWDDIVRMRTLNGDQKRKGLQMHICPLQLDLVERLIERYSNPGETVYDPFGGLMTVPYMAVRMGREGVGCELSAEYFRDGVGYLQAADAGRDVASLMDFAGGI